MATRRKTTEPDVPETSDTENVTPDVPADTDAPEDSQTPEDETSEDAAPMDDDSDVESVETAPARVEIVGPNGPDTTAYSTERAYNEGAL